MPAFVTHELFGTHVFSSLEEPIQELLEQNPAPYFWGLQGPDLMFFRDAILRRSILPRYASILHRAKTDELFTALSCYLTMHKGRPAYGTLAAYVLGFVGHYCLDCEAHPYIYFKQMQKERALGAEMAIGVHSRIESDIDTAFYELKKGRNIREYRPAKRLYGTEEEYELIARMYVMLLWEVYGLRVRDTEIKKCFRDASMMIQLSLDRKGALLPLVGAAEMMMGKPSMYTQHFRRKEVKEDILNLEHEPWFCLQTPDKVDTRSFPQIFYYAGYKAVDMMESIYHCSQHGIVYDPKNLKSFDYGSPDDAGNE